MIEITKMADGTPLIISSVTDISDSMGFCENKIKLLLKGIKPPQTQATIEGTESHDKEIEIEKEHFIPVPVSEEELADSNKDIEFALETVYTRLVKEIKYTNQKLLLLVLGVADKVTRSNGILTVEDLKFPANPEKFLGKSEPFDDQMLQVLLYLNSNFSMTDSINPKDWFELSHKKKQWIVNIKDKGTHQSAKIFRGFQTKENEELLSEKLKKFALITIGAAEPAHNNNPMKCRSCRFMDCEFRL